MLKRLSTVYGLQLIVANLHVNSRGQSSTTGCLPCQGNIPFRSGRCPVLYHPPIVAIVLSKVVSCIKWICANERDYERKSVWNQWILSMSDAKCV